MVSTQIITIALLATATLDSVTSHSQMRDPEPNWPANRYWGDNSPSGIIDSYKDFPPINGMSYSAGGYDNTNAFLAAFKAQSKYKTVTELVDALYQPASNALDRKCGVTLPTGTPRQLPNVVKWDSLFHVGPCEVYCDDVLAYHKDQCENMTELPYDKSKCVGKSTLRSVWAALHGPMWQIYINCATLAGASPTTPPTTTPPPTTPPPTTTTKAPTPPPTTTTRAPTPSVTTPTPTTAAPPSAGGLACNYEGTIYKICRNANAWSYENGAVCVGISRCVSQSPPYGVITL